MTEMSIRLLSSLMQGKTTLFQYFGLGACLYKLLYLRETVVLVQILVLVRRFVALYWQRSGLYVGTSVTSKRSMIQCGR